MFLSVRLLKANLVFLSRSLKLLSENLTTLELLQIFNKHVLPLVKEDDIAPTQQKPTQGKKRLKK